MHEQLLGYLLGALEPHEHEVVEGHLQRDEKARCDLELLRRGLMPLSCDQGHYDPPPALALRTCQHVRARAESPRLAPAVVGAASSGTWSFHDMAVAAGILVAATLLFLPALSHSRQQARSALCQDHLRQVGLALHQYAQQQSGFFPYVPASGRLAFAGMYGSTLKETGFLSDDRLLLCPCCKLCDEPDFHVPTRQELLEATAAQFVRLRNFAGGSFGYTSGHVVDGHYRGTRDQHRAHFALASDSPNPQRADRCSARHGRCGQNVLFEDGHVAYLKCNTEESTGDNVFLNADGLLAPGTHPEDAVIFPPGAPLPEFEAVED